MFVCLLYPMFFSSKHTRSWNWHRVPHIMRTESRYPFRRKSRRMTDSCPIKKGKMISGVRRYDRRVWYQGSESRALAKRFFFFFALCMLLLLFAILVSPKAVGTNTLLLFSYGNIGCNNLVQFRVTDPFAAPPWLLLLLLRILPTPSAPFGGQCGGGGSQDRPTTSDQEPSTIFWHTN